MMLAKLEALVRSTIDGQQCLDDIVECVNADPADILTVVQAIGGALSSKDVSLREKGVGLLADVVEQVALPQGHPTFACARANDIACLPLILRLMLVLIRAESVQQQDAQKIVKTLFSDISVQQLAQKARYLAFNILSSYVNHHHVRGDHDSMDFVFGFIQCMDGEKDPRNLLFCFRLAQSVMSSFDFTNIAEDFFEVLACYFPITFRPPPDDPYGITREDLAKDLCVCLSHPLFAPFALPMIMEKLEASGVVPKISAMELIQAATKFYPPEIFVSELANIWRILKKEIFTGGEENSDQMALETAKALLPSLMGVSTLTSVVDGKEEEVTSPSDFFLNLILVDCLERLSEPDTKVGQIAMSALGQISRASSDIHGVVLRKVLPPVIFRHNNDESLPGRRFVYETILGFLTANRDVIPENTNYLNPISGFIPQLLEILLPPLTRADVIPSLRAVCTQSVGLISQIAGHNLNDDTIIAILNNLVEVLYDKENELNETACNSITMFADKYPKLTQHSVLKKLLACNSIDGTKSRILLKLSKESSFRHPILRFLTGLLEKDHDEMEHTDLILQTIRFMIGTEDESFAAEILTILFAHLQRILIQKSAKEFQKCACTMMRIMSSEKQISFLSEAAQKLQQTHNVILVDFYTSILCTARPDIEIEAYSENSMEFIQSLYQRIVAAESIPSGICFCFVIASIINKTHDDLKISFVNSILNSFDDYSEIAICLLVWVTKSLIIRAHSNGYDLLGKLLALLPTPDGPIASKHFSVLISDDEVLSKGNFANVKFLFRQRFFNHCMPILEEGFQTSTAEYKQVYLLTLISLLPHVPKSLLLEKVDALLPMVLDALELSDMNLRAVSVGIIATVTEVQPILIGPYIGLLTKTLLKNCRFSADNSIAVRCAALNCLSNMTKLPYETLFPYRQEIIRGLANAVNDPKRKVRKEAVICRNKWFLLK